MLLSSVVGQQEDDEEEKVDKDMTALARDARRGGASCCSVGCFVHFGKK